MNALVLLSELATGGAERVTVSFVRNLAVPSLTASVCTVTRRHDGPLAAELARAGIRRFDLGAARLSDPRAPLRLRRLLAAERIDVVHAHGQDAAIIAAALRRVHPTPLVVTRHVIAEPERSLRERLRARAALWAFRTADAAVAVSAAAADRLAELADIERDNIEVIYNGVDLQQFATVPPHAARRALHAELTAMRSAAHSGPHWSVDDPLILMPAVLRAGKGHEHMLTVMRAISAHVPNARLLLAGAGEREPALRVAAAPLGERVVFLGARHDMPVLYAASDLVVLPSLSEALPTALIEAAAAGKACVASAVGGTGEVVEHDRTGLLVDAASPADFAQAVITLLMDPVRAAGMGHRARLRARLQFGLERQVARTLALWQRVVEQQVFADDDGVVDRRWSKL